MTNNPEFVREIQDQIVTKRIKQDKNGNEFLILELDQGESIFVFNNKETPIYKWVDLQEGTEYLFTVKEGKLIGTNILTAFKRIDFII